MSTPVNARPAPHRPPRHRRHDRNTHHLPYRSLSKAPRSPTKSPQSPRKPQSSPPKSTKSFQHPYLILYSISLLKLKIRPTYPTKQAPRAPNPNQASAPQHPPRISRVLTFPLPVPAFLMSQNTRIQTLAQYSHAYSFPDSLSAITKHLTKSTICATMVIQTLFVRKIPGSEESPRSQLQSQKFFIISERLVKIMSRLFSMSSFLSSPYSQSASPAASCSPLSSCAILSFPSFSTS